MAVARPLVARLIEVPPLPVGGGLGLPFVLPPKGREWPLRVRVEVWDATKTKSLARAATVAKTSPRSHKSAPKRARPKSRRKAA